MLKIAKENLNKVYAKIAETMGLFIPIKKGGEVNYHVWGEGKEVSLETLKTVKSPKNMFFPQTENMMKFKTDGKNIEVIDYDGNNRSLFELMPSQSAGTIRPALVIADSVLRKGLAAGE